MITLHKKIHIIIALCFLVGISFFAGLLVKSEFATAEDRLLNSKKLEVSQKLDLSDFWKVWDLMDKRYVYSGTASSTPDSDKIDGAIKGLVAALGDPYSEYLPAEEKNLFDEELSGSLEGIGVVVGIRDDVLTAISPIKDSPADKAGVKAGDIIYKIDGTESVSMTVSEAVKRIKGKKGTKVTLSLIRKGEPEPIEISIIRDKILVPTLETEVLEGGIYKIKLFEFNALSVSLFKDAMQKFNQGNYKKLILDLRNNPGGYLESAVEMASYFLPQGKVIVTEDYGNKKEAQVHRSLGYNTFKSNAKMVILINGGSASASEILAGALNDYGIATLVGETSFGKGSVQELISVTKDTSLKLTVARWLLPKGAYISKVGITPKFVVKPTLEEQKSGKDVQLEKAVQVLK